MPFEISADERNGIVVARLWDEVDSAEHRAARSDAARLCHERGFKRLLVDLRGLVLRKALPTFNCYDFGESLADGPLPKRTLIAHVMPSDKIAYHDVRFTGTVAKNRGALLEEFDTVDAARQWLLSHPLDTADGQAEAERAEPSR